MRLMHWKLKLNRSVMNFKYSSSFFIILLLLLSFSCGNQPSKVKSVSSSFYFDDLSGRVVNAMDSVLDVKDKKSY